MTAALALMTVVLALFVGTAWVTSAFTLPIWLRAVQHHKGLARTAGGVSALPWLAGLAVALGAVLPGDPHTGQMFTCHCTASMASWLHLCPVHPAEASWLALPALLVLAALLPGRVQGIKELVHEPLGHGGGHHPRVVDLAEPIAVLHGWMRPTLVVDRRLWHALSEAEREAVVAHEQGHLRRRDPFVLMWIRTLLVLAPQRHAHRLARVWLQHAELRADAEAARIVGDSAVVAQALVQCARLGVSPSPALAVSWTGGALDDRIRALVERPITSRVARPDLGALDLLFLAVLAVLGVLATPWVHHHVEHLLNLSL